MKPYLQFAHRSITIEQAWLNLAADVLIFTINDVRQNRDLQKREKARKWLMSPAAALFFDVIINPQFDLCAWISANCPELEK